MVRSTPFRGSSLPRITLAIKINRSTFSLRIRPRLSTPRLSRQSMPSYRLWTVRTSERVNYTYSMGGNNRDFITGLTTFKSLTTIVGLYDFYVSIGWAGLLRLLGLSGLLRCKSGIANVVLIKKRPFFGAKTGRFLTIILI